jgi:hypothetical protein
VATIPTYLVGKVSQSNWDTAASGLATELAAYIAAHPAAPDPSIKPSTFTTQQDWQDFSIGVYIQLQTQAWAKPDRFLHIAGPQAIEIIRQLYAIGGANADKLSKIGINGPNAIEITRQMKAGVGDVGALHRMGFSASDATALAAAITWWGVNNPTFSS